MSHTVPTYIPPLCTFHFIYSGTVTYPEITLWHWSPPRGGSCGNSTATGYFAMELARPEEITMGIVAGYNYIATILRFGLEMHYIYTSSASGDSL